MTEFLYTLTTPNSTQLTGVDPLFRSCLFIGISGFRNGFPVNNTGTVFLGLANNKHPIAIATGEELNWDASQNKGVGESITNFWVKGFVGDGLYVIRY